MCTAERNIITDACIPVRLYSERLSMNTRVSYRYADKTDCRQFTSVVLSGTITWAQIAPYLTTRSFFIPGQLGLEDLQHRFALPGADHPWHQMAPDDIKPTEDTPTIVLTGGELADRFAHTPWEADWFVNGYALRPVKAIYAEPARPVDTTPHTYAQDKGWPPVKPVRSRAKRTSTRSKP
jgi:hypothetical protein